MHEEHCRQVLGEWAAVASKEGEASFAPPARVFGDRVF
jgi:hypothetical protein